MIADELRPTPSFGVPDATVLQADAFHREIVEFIERELPVWRDRPNRPQLMDEPNLNQTLCLRLNSASRRQSFDAVQFLQEPLQSSARRGDIGVMPLGMIIVEGRTYDDFEQLLPIECKRAPTPPDIRRGDVEYVHGLAGHRTGAIERFKHGLHGPTNRRALIIAYVQEESFDHWLAIINARLALLSKNGTDEGLWRPAEALFGDASNQGADVQKLTSKHRRLVPPSSSSTIDMEHLWLRMN